MSKRINVAAGERTLFPVDKATQVALKAFEGDKDGRVLVRLDIPEATDSDEWSEATDLLTGRAVAVRRADCGLGCKCAAEVKLVRQGSLLNVATDEERQLLSEAIDTAIDSQADTLAYAESHMEDYDAGDVDNMRKRIQALTELGKRI